MTWLKVGQAAEVWQVSPTKVKHWIVTGRLPATNVGQKGKRPQYRIHVDAIKELKPETPSRRSRLVRGEHDHGI